MKSFEVLPHTADFRLKIIGDTIEELFLAGVLGMAQVIKEGYCEKEKNLSLIEKVSISSPDQTALLIDFLSEILTISQTQKSVICSVKFIKLSKTEVEAEIFGKKVDGFDEDIKAVTYHEAEIKRNTSGNYQTIIIFDI